MPLSFSEYWIHLDALGKSVTFLLMVLSIISWLIIGLKGWMYFKARHTHRYIPHFWQAPDFSQAIHNFKLVDSEGLYVSVAEQAAQVEQLLSQTSSSTCPTALQHHFNREESYTRAIRLAMDEVSVKLEWGLTFLATIGATSPFIGLLGTVWGIYHALGSIDSSSVQLDKLADPVGETLIMTGIGLMVAIPAVLFYNFFLKNNRVHQMRLEGFAYDLHAYFVKSH